MIKILPTLTLALFAAVSFGAHAASHGGAAPMKAEAASAPASGAMMKKEEMAAAKEMKKDDKAHAKEMKADAKDKKMEMKAEKKEATK